MMSLQDPKTDVCMVVLLQTWGWLFDGMPSWCQGSFLSVTPVIQQMLQRHDSISAVFQALQLFSSDGQASRSGSLTLLSPLTLLLPRSFVLSLSYSLAVLLSHSTDSHSLTLSICLRSHPVNLLTPSLFHSLRLSFSNHNQTWSEGVDLLCQNSTPSSVQADTCRKTPVDIWFNIALLSLPTPSLHPPPPPPPFFYCWIFPSSLRFFWSLQFSTGSP